MPLEVVYVLSNPGMPGFVKIGKTAANDVNIRLAQLYTTGVPFPFELEFACNVQNSDEVEKALHTAFGPNRVNPKREFFKIEPAQAIAILKLLHVEDATSQIESMPSSIPSEDLKAGEQYKSRRPNFNFREMGIPIGAQLLFNDGASTAKVVGDKRVELNGVELSLTAATRQLLGIDYSVQSGPFWTYDGKLLSDLYEATYSID